MSGTKPGGDPFGPGRLTGAGRDVFLIRWVGATFARLRLGLASLLSAGVTDTGYVAVDDVGQMRECVPA